MRPLVLLTLLAGCTETGVLRTYPLAEFDYALELPTYGSFAGDGPIRVKGQTGTPDATLLVEGQRIPIAEDGTFDVLIPIEGPYRIVDIEASYLDERVEDRIPVFNGFDPRETWPGGLSLRLTDVGLDNLGDLLGALVDELLVGGLTDLVPPPADEGFQFELLSVTAAPTDVRMEPGPEGVAVTLAMRDIVVDMEVRGEVLGFDVEVPITLTLPVLDIGVAAFAGVGEDGQIALSFGEPDIAFDPPGLAFGAVGFDWLTDLIFDQIDIDTLLDEQVAGLLDGAQELTLGEGLDFETDLFGLSLALGLAEVRTDELGVGIGFAVGLDEPAPDGVPVDIPDGDYAEPVDLSVAVHEGILQPLLDSELLDLLEQDISLPNPFGAILGGLVSGLPGGSQAPQSAGWCIGLTPGDAKLARFVEGNDPLMAIYLPDAIVDIGRIPEPGASCQSWLTASLALEVGFAVSGGTQLGFDISAPEGKVLFYGATDVPEDEVIEALGGTLGNLLDLLGGFANIDLADILGEGGGDAGEGGLIPGLDGLSLEVRGAQPILDEAGEPIPGLHEIGIQLF
jgi:hypothetical protein